jgi:hypothetical protein
MGVASLHSVMTASARSAPPTPPSTRSSALRATQLSSSGVGLYQSVSTLPTYLNVTRCSWQLSSQWILTTRPTGSTTLR